MEKNRLSELDGMVSDIDKNASGLTDWEIKFIASLVDDPPAAYSDKQIIVIERLYKEYC